MNQVAAAVFVPIMKALLELAANPAVLVRKNLEIVYLICLLL